MRKWIIEILVFFFFINFGFSAKNQVLNSDENTISFYHFERILPEGKIYDSSPYGIHGKVTPSVKLVKGKIGNCLFFNGVDSAMWLERKVSLSAIIGTSIEFWICPDSSPHDSVESIFREVFKEEDESPVNIKGKVFKDYSFTWKDWKYFASLNPPEWGVYFWKSPYRLVRGKEGSDMYVLCCDSPFSSARQQLFLRRNDGKLVWRSTGGHGKKGVLQYRSMISKSVVWEKGKWTHVKVELNPYSDEFKLYINGILEDKTPIQALPPTHVFILGGSFQEGVPFKGRIDELCVRKIISDENFIFPYGTMEVPFYEYDKGINLPVGIMPLNLVPGKDIAERESEEIYKGKYSLKLKLSESNKGIICEIHPFIAGRYNIELRVKGKNGKVILKSGLSREISFSKELEVIELNDEWQKISTELKNPYFFILFTEKGDFFIDEIKVKKLK